MSRLEELESEVRYTLVRLWWYVRLLRSYNEHRDTNICGIQYYKFIFDRLIDSSVHLIIIDICAISDDKNKNGNTIQRWIDELIIKHPQLSARLRTLKADLMNLTNGSEYDGIKTRRDKMFAHRDMDKSKIATLPGGKYGDLFDIVKCFINIYDEVSNMCLVRTVDWNGEPDAQYYATVDANAHLKPEEILSLLLSDLEKCRHKESWHKKLNFISSTPK